MPIQNDIPHRAAPITVADNSGTKSPAAPGKPGPGHPTPGNANAPTGVLPDVKRDPQRARSRDIDLGLKKITLEQEVELGEILLTQGIEDVVIRFVGEKNYENYDNAKPCTDDILLAYPHQPLVVWGVNYYLQVYLADSLKSGTKPSDLTKTVNYAVKYVTDSGPNSMSPSDRLNGLIDMMKQQHVDQKKIDAVKMNCERAMAYAP